MAIVMDLVRNLLSLCMWVFTFGLKTMFIVIHTWVELVASTVIFHLNMFRKTMIWMVAFIFLPIRVLTALQREKLLEECLQEMQIELENLLWDRKELKGQLHTAAKERRIFESMLAEVEEENDRAIAKIELLEGKLQTLKLENLQLKDTLGKVHCIFKGHNDSDSSQDIGIPYGIQSWKSSYKGSGIIMEDLMMQKDTWESDESKSKAELLGFLKTGSAPGGPIHSLPGFFSRSIDVDDLEQRREVALSQSFFSAGLSLLVGMISWEAEDPCIPLVIALFTVVGMSLKSVVNFFATIKNKPASDAVALLSLNWFMLGTLTYPTLPRVAHMLGPLASSFFNFLTGQ